MFYNGTLDIRKEQKNIVKQYKKQRETAIKKNRTIFFRETRKTRKRKKIQKKISREGKTNKDFERTNTICFRNSWEFTIERKKTKNIIESKTKTIFEKKKSTVDCRRIID